MWSLLILSAFSVVLQSIDAAGVGAARLVCYVENARAIDYNECTHLVYAGNERGEALENVLKEYRQVNPRLKIILRANDEDQDLRNLFKTKQIQGLELYNVHRTLNKTQVLASVETARAAISSNGGGPLILSLPAHPELLAKYYDLRSLVKHVDLMVLETHDLGVVKKMTYHPSRLSGLWDMMNTDSVVDLAVGLGVPASKLIISLPATVRRFTLSNESLSTPGSPTEEDEPQKIDQGELCRLLRSGRWTLERDQDLSAPYAFQNKTWLAFEDSSSTDVKGKYARVRGLAGLALRNADDDVETPCGPTLRAALGKVLNQQSRAPRAAVLRSLEHEILSAGSVRALDALQVSPYRITQVVDSDGVIHSIREDTRTEFSCSRQGYFVHPRSCARFYRCVKFDQLSPDYTVFEFDCPAGLVFDPRVEVCVWPGSVPASHACPGSSEIAPVPQTRFICPKHEGYYVDPENCRWFFACIDHGKSPLAAYEFRCPFGLGFDAERLKCDWPWLVPACGNIGRYEAEAFGFSGASLIGATRFNGQTAEAINIAAHQNLVSGASLNNHVGIQNDFLNRGDLLDANFITSQELANSQLDRASQLTGPNLAVAINHNIGLIQPTNFESEPKYSSGSLILDDYRYPSEGRNKYPQASRYYENAAITSSNEQGSLINNNHNSDDSGAYVHDPTGDRAEPYRHIEGLGVPYVHQDSKYNNYNDHQSYSQYSDYGTKYNNNGDQYVQDNSEKYVAGIYKSNTNLNTGSNLYASKNIQSAPHYNLYNDFRSNDYVANNKAYTGASHTLAAGSINVGLVGKTSLVDSGFVDQFNYKNNYGNQDTVYHVSNNGHLDLVSEPVVSISHAGTDFHNLDSYASYVTTPTSSGVPTTATPYAVTTPSTLTTVSPIVSTYKTTFVTEQPKTTVKQIFYSQPALTVVRPTVVPVQQINPLITNYNQAVDHQTFETKQAQTVHNINANEFDSSGYEYPKPEVKFEEGISVTTQTPITVSTFKPKEYSDTQNVGQHYLTPINEEPFKKVIAYTTGTQTEYSEPTLKPILYDQKLHYLSNSDGSALTSKKYDGYQDIGAHAYSNSYNQKTIHEEENSQSNVEPLGYNYDLPKVYFDQRENQSPTHEILHNVAENNKENTFYGFQNGYEYKNVDLKQSEYITKQTTPQPQTFSHQIIHSEDKYDKTNYSPKYEFSTLSTTQPTTFNYQGEVSTENYHKTYQNSNGYQYKNLFEVNNYKTVQTDYENPPKVFNQKTYHTIDTSKIDLNQEVGYDYARPNIEFLEQNIPNELSTYRPVEPLLKPQIFSKSSQNTNSYHSISSTFAPKADLNYQQPAVTFYENPLLKYNYKQQQADLTYTQPILIHKLKQNPLVGQINQHLNGGYSYNQPEIQRNIETVSTGLSYSQANDVSHQYYQQHFKTSKLEDQKVAFVSTTPANLVYEEHYAEYEGPKKFGTYKAPEYIPPKKDFIISTTNSPNIQYSNQYEISRNTPLQHLSFTTSHTAKQSQPVESIHSAQPGPSITTTYKPLFYQAPEIQLNHKDEEFIAPVSSTEKHVSTTYSPVVFSSTPNVYQHRVPTPRPKYTPEIQFGYKSEEYLLPVVSKTYKTKVFPTTPSTIIYVSTTPKELYQEPQVNIDFKTNEYLPPIASTDTPVTSTISSVFTTKLSDKEYLPPPVTKRPIVKYTTPTTFQYVDSTTPFKAPEYLPPVEETDYNFQSLRLKNVDSPTSKPEQYLYQDVYTVKSSTSLPVPRKQNIVVQTAKSNLLGFGTVGPDAGIVSPVSYTTTPISSTESYLANDQSYTTYKPQIIEGNNIVPKKRTKPKVAVVTKINDYNPLLVRKLGAVCSCQTPIVILRGRRPKIQVEDYDIDYNTDYNDSDKDISEELIREYEKIRIPSKTKSITVTTSTFNPIIVPDDSYYQDLTENKDQGTKLFYTESSEPSTFAHKTEKIVKIRPRARLVTQAPTYQSVILNKVSSTTPSSVIDNEERDASFVNTDQVDRYGSGKTSVRNAALQGSVDCQRPGLFRHPKHCNKFYSCRWDDHKKRYALHVFNCPVQLSFDPNLGACNWPSQGPACQGDTLLSNTI